MAASCQNLAFNLRNVLSTTIRSSLSQRWLTPSAVPALNQVRHKSSSKPRVREAKVSVDKNRKFISKKERKNALAKAFNTKEEAKEEFLADAPVDNVWVRRFYPQQKITIEDAIERHKAFAQPAMLDNMDGLMYLDMRLDFRTKKQTKFMSNIRSTLLLPHNFDFGPPPSILVFCKTEENLSLAVSLGAKHAGLPAEVIKLIENGVLNPRDFQHVLSTPDCAMEIMPVRSHFRDKFPQKAKGNLSPDLSSMWNLFYNGYTYESQKMTDAMGKMQVPVGKINMNTEQLVENFEAFIEDICRHRSIALGPFIQSISVVAPPSPEVFLVKVEEYVPGYKNEAVDSDEEDEVAKD